jgi:hypothetical protein
MANKNSKIGTSLDGENDGNGIIYEAILGLEAGTGAIFLASSNKFLLTLKFNIRKLEHFYFFGTIKLAFFCNNQRNGIGDLAKNVEMEDDGMNVFWMGLAQEKGKGGKGGQQK